MNTEIQNVNNMSSITSAPITREEVAMLFTGSVKAQAEIVENFNKKLDKYFGEKLKEQAEALTKLVTRNELAVTRIENAIAYQIEQNQEIAKGFSAALSEQSNINNERGNKIANLMFDFTSTFASNMAKLKDELISNAEKQTDIFKDLLRDKSASKPDKKQYPAIEARNIPSDIRKICQKLYPGMSDVKAFNRLYREMENISMMNISNYINKKRNTVGYKRFSRAYFISKDAFLTALFNQAVEELSKEA